jgi:hypothetical protein
MQVELSARPQGVAIVPVHSHAVIHSTFAAVKPAPNFYPRLAPANPRDGADPSAVNEMLFEAKMWCRLQDSNL